MRTPEDRKERQREGERRKDAAHVLLEARCDVLIRRARRALLFRPPDSGVATADDVAERVGRPTLRSTLDGSAPFLDCLLLRGSFVGLAIRTRSTSGTLRSSPFGNGDRAAALVWLARHPDLSDAEPDARGSLCPSTPKPSGPTPLAASLSQPKLF